MEIVLPQTLCIPIKIRIIRLPLLLATDVPSPRMICIIFVALSLSLFFGRIIADELKVGSGQN